ncbi:MAG: NAD-dependent epimerase/dehydratase family protein [Actinobacteria bacterium]|nr:NAD-dependent epimerase/dehydratase family protein [Actinomycetota bacterium]
MTSLITGAFGFVGPHLADHLRAEGDTVVSTDRSSGADICDPAAMEALFNQHRPRFIYHLAGDSDVGGSWNHPLDTFRANAEGTLNVLTAARSAGVERVVVIGSADVYGKVAPDELPLTERSELRPTSPYAASKVAADYVALQAWLGYGLEVVRVRAFNHLGPGQSDRFVAPAIAMRIARNELDGNASVPVGNLDARRDITDVRDVVRAYRLLAHRGVPGEVYNVCSGQAIRIGDLAERLIALATRPMELVSDQALLRPVDIPILLGDNDKLRAATGWQPVYSIDQTLSDLMDDCRSRLRSAV